MDLGGLECNTSERKRNNIIQNEFRSPRGLAVASQEYVSVGTQNIISTFTLDTFRFISVKQQLVRVC